MENYSIQATDSNPLLLSVTVDRSSSTSQQFPDGKTTSEVIAEATNSSIEEMLTMCTSHDSLKDKFYLNIVSYGHKTEVLINDPISRVKPIETQTIQENFDGVLIQVEKPIFIKPFSSGTTPMHEAFSIIRDNIKNSYEINDQCPAAVLINISDGMPDDEQLTIDAAAEIQGLSNPDGNALIFNAHVDHTGQETILFPTSEDDLPNEYAKFMFRISSDLPESYIKYSNSADNGLPTIQVGAKAMIFNAQGPELLKLIQLGTISGK